MTGRIHSVRFESLTLQNNAPRDPSVRDLYLYLPPSYDNSDSRYPVVYCLVGFTGSARSWFNFQAWVPAIDERLRALIDLGMPEMIVVFPDCFTVYGGSQYLDSPAVGNYRSYLSEEIVPWVDRNFRTKADRRYRAVMGKSSGGYGAITLTMSRPDMFSAVACHSGDMYFEYVYMPDFPAAFRVLEKNGGAEPFLKNFLESPRFGKEDHATINTIAMSACYSPNLNQPPLLFDLPFDTKTGKLIPEVWSKWKEKDPVQIVETQPDSLRDTGLIFIDCGSRDEFSLNIGSRIFCETLKKHGIPHEYEEFDGGHFNIQHRYNISLRKIAAYFHH